MACDLTVMVDDAFIRHVGLEHGSVPAGGATQWLPIMVGDRRAREIILLCDEIPAAQAAEWGLVNRAVPAAELDAVVDEFVEKLARKLPETTRYAKQQLNWWRDISWHETVGHARDWLALSMLGEEAQGAIRAFLDRLKPKHPGDGAQNRAARPPAGDRGRPRRDARDPERARGGRDDITGGSASPRADGRPARAPGRVVALRAGSVTG